MRPGGEAPSGALIGSATQTSTSGRPFAFAAPPRHRRRSLCRLVARASGASDAEDADDLLAREFEKASNPLGPRKSAARLELLWSASQVSAVPRR
jgi:hypothetical protein